MLQDYYYNDFLRENWGANIMSAGTNDGFAPMILLPGLVVGRSKVVAFLIEERVDTEREIFCMTILFLFCLFNSVVAQSGG